MKSKFNLKLKTKTGALLFGNYSLTSMDKNKTSFSDLRSSK